MACSIPDQGGCAAVGLNLQKMLKIQKNKKIWSFAIGHGLVVNTKDALRTSLRIPCWVRSHFWVSESKYCNVQINQSPDGLCMSRINLKIFQNNLERKKAQYKT